MKKVGVVAAAFILLDGLATVANRKKKSNGMFPIGHSVIDWVSNVQADPSDLSDHFFKSDQQEQDLSKTGRIPDPKGVHGQGSLLEGR